MHDISGSQFECETIAHLLRGPRAAPVVIDYSPGNGTQYRLCIVPLRATHYLTSLHSGKKGHDLFLVTWLDHCHFLVDASEPITQARVHHDIHRTDIASADSRVLAQFLNRILRHTQVNDGQSHGDAAWSPGDPRTPSSVRG
jgi:hypothetical protein